MPIEWADAWMQATGGDGVAGRYPSRRVGGGSIVELWVPAEELTDFNCHIVGQIRVVAEFPGEAAGP